VDRDKLRAMLELHEGIRYFPYVDTVGKLTIGVGRNLTDKGLAPSEVSFMLTNDVLEVEQALDVSIPWWRGLNEVRQLVLADMCFNLGIAGLLRFKNTLGHMQVGNYELAADNMMLSKWATQVGSRASKLSRMMRTGQE